MTNTSPYLFVASIVGGGRPSSSGILSLPVVFKPDSAWALWCSTPARWTTSKVIPEGSRRQRASDTVLSVNFETHFKDARPMRMVSRVPFKYSLSKIFAQGIATTFSLCCAVRTSGISEVSRPASNTFLCAVWLL